MPESAEKFDELRAISPDVSIELGKTRGEETKESRKNEKWNSDDDDNDDVKEEAEEEEEEERARSASKGTVAVTCEKIGEASQVREWKRDASLTVVDAGGGGKGGGGGSTGCGRCRGRVVVGTIMSGGCVGRREEGEDEGGELESVGEDQGEGERQSENEPGKREAAGGGRNRTARERERDGERKRGRES